MPSQAPAKPTQWILRVQSEQERLLGYEPATKPATDEQTIALKLFGDCPHCEVGPMTKFGDSWRCGLCKNLFELIARFDGRGALRLPGEEPRG